MTNKFSRNIQLTLQFIRLALISGAIFIFLLISAGAVLTYIYRDEVKDLMIQSLNHHLKTDIHVENIQLDLFRRLPNASLTFENVVAYEVSPGENQDTLVKADRIYFQFSIIDLINKDYKIKQLEVSGGIFKPVDHADGTNNYIFWEASEAQSGQFEFDLQRIDLKNFEIDYRNLQQKSRYHFYLTDSRMSGQFSQNDFVMDISSDMIIRELDFNNSPFLSNREIGLDLSLLVNDNGVYEFREGWVNLNGNSFNIDGYIEQQEPGSYLDLAISGKEVSLQNFINDLPWRYRRYFSDYNSKGNLYFNAIVKGNSSENQNPYISANFGLSNGSMNNRDLDLDLDNINFTAQFTNGDSRALSSSKLNVEDFSAYINNGKVAGGFTIMDFLKPHLQIAAKSEIELVDFVNIFELEKVKTASGEMFIDIDMESELNNLDKESFIDEETLLSSDITGNLKLKDAHFTLKDDPKEYNDFNGVFQFNNNDLIVSNFEGLIFDNDFSMTGYFRNILPYLFHQDQRMIIDASFVSDKINLDELLQDRASESDTTYNLTFSERVDFNLLAEIGQFNFRKFEATDLTGNFQMNNQRFVAKDILFNSMDGKFDGNVYIDGANQDVLLIGCDANLDNVDVQQMFYQFGNFGQEGIKDENIKGNINADLQFTSDWSPSLEIDWESLETTADIRVNDGELIDFKPILALSRFLRVEELEHVMFSTLHNEIRIKDREVIIPEMEINSNAFNIKISGKHNFDNEIDYRLQVLLSDILAQKNRERRNPQEQYGDVIDDGLGRTTLYLVLNGTIDDPDFGYDYQGVREKVRDDLRRERQELRDLLKDEFSWIRSEDEKQELDSIMLERQKETERIKKQEEGEFVIEFEDL